MKIADQAENISTEDKVSFRASLDSFAGNSGSPVIDLESHKVIGILVKGSKDYIADHSCYRPNTCIDLSCSGEAVTMTHFFAPFIAEGYEAPGSSKDNPLMISNEGTSEILSLVGELYINNNET